MAEIEIEITHGEIRRSPTEIDRTGKSLNRNNERLAAAKPLTPTSEAPLTSTGARDARTAN